MQIQFSKDSHDPFIDFLKGVCILMVIINHGALEFSEQLLFPLWVFHAVPLFLLIQAFHVYKEAPAITPTLPSWQKIWKRILFPFLVAELFLFCWGIGKSLLTGEGMETFLRIFRKQMGVGAGTYYIWIYVQFALLIPLLYKVAKHKYGAWIFAALCIALEIFLSYSSIPGSIYRILCLRYLFLIYLGYVWAKKGIVLNGKTLALAMVSIIAILFLTYRKQWFPAVDLAPFVYTKYWPVFHWFTYFLPAFLLPVIIYRLFVLSRHTRIHDFLIVAGKQSYEVFLFQMMLFYLIPDQEKTFKLIGIAICLLPIFYYQYRSGRLSSRS